ncbi:subclass B1 metallo-beta-lactamase [Shewanella maritima]|uniref:subclass B1 metallo-beta-lactamase n=1 Tax=Shewanella maritima TaxID=2520507 RepID=UPI003735EFE7
MPKFYQVIVIFLLIHLPISAAQSKPSDLQISQLTENLYLHKSYQLTDSFGLVSSNGLIYIAADQQSAYLIDTPWSEADTIKLVEWLDEQGYELKASISTHSHDDRTAGMGYLNSLGINTHASTLTNQLLTQQNKPTSVSSFNGNKLNLLDEYVEVYFVGAGHTIDNLVVWFPKTKLLYGGCMVKSINSKSLGYIAEADLQAWPQSIATLKQQFGQAKQVLPGHGKIGNTELLTHTQKLLKAHKSINQ